MLLIRCEFNFVGLFYFFLKSVLSMYVQELEPVLVEKFGIERAISGICGDMAMSRLKVIRIFRWFLKELLGVHLLGT